LASQGKYTFTRPKNSPPKKKKENQEQKTKKTPPPQTSKHQQQKTTVKDHGENVLQNPGHEYRLLVRTLAQKGGGRRYYHLAGHLKRATSLTEWARREGGRRR